MHTETFQNTPTPPPMYQPAATDRFSKIEALTTLAYEAIETSVITFRAWRGHCHPDTVRLEGLCWILNDVLAEAQAGKKQGNFLPEVTL